MKVEAHSHAAGICPNFRVGSMSQVRCIHRSGHSSHGLGRQVPFETVSEQLAIMSQLA